MAAVFEDRGDNKFDIEEKSMTKVALHGEQDDHLVVQLPPILASLSEEELAAVDKAATRKVDILLLPTLFILYVLNYLDRQSKLILPLRLSISSSADSQTSPLPRSVA